ncbi:cupin domain-containing protein [Buchananella hordeovulneris]|uniref:Cupin n=1 Tax=Buchananella hordeovulneris TaxID=52770 RepID=A0A1Q5PUL6_9ACTO|nr:cupin domain-containing protein [Buchananella hordeovulneris]MDO5081457.1 cupin domain-containing protein [Buchananella hordeovulneris]OKL51271.1 cupin [Buchananella hordeovulneris]RRD43419.1 cupin domain-containing protein [Buchananella hordeovulneris]RRD51036.1 cupin domain-containing protein [Buchananella hordeovulneris]
MSDQLTVIADLAELTAVQDDSTVSRTVLKAEGARCVLFAFDAGQVLTEHTAAMPVLITVLSGALRVMADGQDVVLRPGGVIHMTTRLPHAVEALEPTKMALYMLDPRQKPAE